MGATRSRSKAQAWLAHSKTFGSGVPCPCRKIKPCPLHAFAHEKIVLRNRAPVSKKTGGLRGRELTACGLKRMGAMQTVSSDILQKMTDRIVERFAPEKVILFGSQAREEAGPDSDVDFLVIMRFEGSRLKLGVEIRKALRGFGVAKDVAILKPEEFELYKDTPGSIAWPAAHGGRILYAA
jgi:predicted nucleotidyltransferase